MNHQPSQTAASKSKRRQQAHRRSARACKECRARKRKCDGQQPCKGCKSAELDCIYQTDKPAATPTEKIRLLEHQLRDATAFLHGLSRRLPVDGKVYVKPILEVVESWSHDSPNAAIYADHDEQKQEVHLASMLAGCQRLINSSPTTTAYYGPLSEASFILRTLELFHKGEFLPEKTLEPLTKMFSWSVPEKDHSEGSGSQSTALSERNTAIMLIESLFNTSHPFTAFLRRDSVRDIIEAVHNPTNAVHLHRHTPSFALYHAVLALGQIAHCKSQRHERCSETIKQAWRHFHAADELIDPQSCADTLSAQALLCQMIFLISTSRMASAHALLGQTYSTLLRLGFHKDQLPVHQMPSHQQTLRMMIFSTAVRIDLYISLILDLPRFISEDLVRGCIEALHRLPEHDAGLIAAASTKHLELLHFACTARESIFGSGETDTGYATIDADRLDGVERGLHHWTNEVSSLMLQIGETAESSMLKYEMEMALYFSQLILFRPFLHYLCIMAKGKALHKIQSRHALACIKIASNTIVRAELLSHQLPDIGATWSTTYTLFLAVMCLIFLISAHEGTSQPGEAWRRAVTGLRGLYADRCIEDCAFAGLEVLEVVVRQLSHTVDFDFRQIEKDAAEARHSIPSRLEAISVGRYARYPSAARDNERDATSENEGSVDHYADADRMLAHAEFLPLGVGFVELLNADLDENIDSLS